MVQRAGVGGVRVAWLQQHHIDVVQAGQAGVVTFLHPHGWHMTDTTCTTHNIKAEEHMQVFVCWSA